MSDTSTISTMKTAPRTMLLSVPLTIKPEHYFYLENGKALRSIEELATALKDMNEAVFKHHVTDTRNDFANWVRDVFGKQDLAARIAPLKSKDLLLREVKKHMFREKARMLFDIPSKYFNERLKSRQAKPVDAGAEKSKISTLASAEKTATPYEKELSKKIDKVLEKEQEIEEEELLLKRKIDAQKKLAAYNFIHGLAIGIIVCLMLASVYVMLK